MKSDSATVAHAVNTGGRVNPSPRLETRSVCTPQLPPECPLPCSRESVSLRGRTHNPPEGLSPVVEDPDLSRPQLLWPLYSNSLALTPGTRLGPYEITAQFGVGGMGQVYRARDSKLVRDVAIKILPEAFAHDAERFARFQREAKTLAALNHQNIAQIHGLEDADGIKALVSSPV